MWGAIEQLLQTYLQSEQLFAKGRSLDRTVEFLRSEGTELQSMVDTFYSHFAISRKNKVVGSLLDRVFDIRMVSTGCGKHVSFFFFRNSTLRINDEFWSSLALIVLRSVRCSHPFPNGY